VVARGLPPHWTEARIRLTVDDADLAQQAAVYLAPLSPGRSGNSFRVLLTPPGGGGATVLALQAAVERLDQGAITGRLVLDESTGPPAATPQEAPTDLATQWDELQAGFPPTWSDVLLEMTLLSSDDIDRAAVLLGPANPLLMRGTPTFHFRAARSFGYGVSTQMARGSLARLDAESIRGVLKPLRLMSDSRPVDTQGPVWRLEGRSV